MALDKSIKNGREHRKEYRGSKAFDYACRNNNKCSAYKGNRLYTIKKAMIKADQTL